MSASASASASANGALKLLNKWKVVGGYVQKYQHVSEVTKTEMKFSVFFPPQAAQKKVPAVYWLSGLTCTDDNFIQKAGAYHAAAQEGIAIICPDTSPRGANIEGDKDAWDFGEGAGFYLNATEPKWSTNYRMYDYVVSELPSLVASHLGESIDSEKKGIMGHSMGGHGALTIFLKNADKYKSVSAFAPICHPSVCPWGIKAFTGYLGADQEKWKQYDATELVRQYQGPAVNILIDQGASDDFLTKGQLLPQDFVKAVDETKAKTGVTVTYREQEGYDHSYFFILSFIHDHIIHHAKALLGKN